MRDPRIILSITTIPVAIASHAPFVHDHDRWPYNRPILRPLFGEVRPGFNRQSPDVGWLCLCLLTSLKRRAGFEPATSVSERHLIACQAYSHGHVMKRQYLPSAYLASEEHGGLLPTVSPCCTRHLTALARLSYRRVNKARK